MAAKQPFTEEELKVDESLGYPKAYAKLCRSPNVLKPYSYGPPSVFVPYTLRPQEALRTKDLNQMFPVIDQEEGPSMNPRGYVNLLWKQLDHLGNAGFDPALFRVDPYGNVLYLHADLASPLAWDIDHWFPRSRGGKTLPSNLRLIQWQVCKKKKKKLEFLVPWWDLQVGISVNQFLLMFASRNSDFRNRAFSFLFPDGGSEELNAMQTADSHSFPQHFIEMKRHLGLAPAAIVSLQRSLDASVLMPLDVNQNLRVNRPLSAGRKSSAEENDVLSMAIQRFRPSISKENTDPDMSHYNTNPYLAIAMARDSLRQREETKKKHEEISQLEGELDELKKKNEAERIALQELEEMLIMKRQRVEKCRGLAEAQASYRALLEKMIRDAMHQAVVYKEQIRLNQAAASAAMASLEAQREICDSSEKEFHRRFKQRDEIEKQIRPCSEHARKRSQTDDILLDKTHDDLLSSMTAVPLRKELRKFLEEEHKASEAGSSLVEEEEEEDTKNASDGERDGNSKAVIVASNQMPNTDHRPMKSAIGVSQFRTATKSKKSSFIQSALSECEEFRTKLVSKNVEPHELKPKKLATTDGLCSKGSKPKEKLLHGIPYAQEQGAIHISNDETSPSNKFEKLENRESQCIKNNNLEKVSLSHQSPHEEEDEERWNQLGKENIERWLKMMLDNAQENSTEDSPLRETHKLDSHMDEIDVQKEITNVGIKPVGEKMGPHEKHVIKHTNEKGCHENKRNRYIDVSGSKVLDKGNQKIGVASSSGCEGFKGQKSFEGKERDERRGGIVRCENDRGYRSCPSSPSVIFSMRKGMDCMGRKPKVIRDEIDDKEECKDNSVATSNSKCIKTWARTSKRSMNE